MVIEVAARLGGGHDAELVEAAVGVDLNGLAIAAALGEPLAVPVPAPRAGGVVTRFLVAPPGILERVEVPEGIQARIYREPGFVFVPLIRGSDRAGALLVVAGSREQALEQADAAAQGIHFHVAAALPDAAALDVS
jgi:biotin carboxylase